MTKAELGSSCKKPPLPSSNGYFMFITLLWEKQVTYTRTHIETNAISVNYFFSI